MQPYRFEFVYLKGEANKVADVVSRTPEFKCYAVEIYAAAPLHLEDLTEAAKKDPTYATPPTARGCKWRKEAGVWKSAKGGRIVVYVPHNDTLCKKIISECYEILLARHLGIKKTCARVSERFC